MWKQFVLLISALMLSACAAAGSQAIDPLTPSSEVEEFRAREVELWQAWNARLVPEWFLPAHGMEYFERLIRPARSLGVLRPIVSSRQSTVFRGMAVRWVRQGRRLRAAWSTWLPGMSACRTARLEM